MSHQGLTSRRLRIVGLVLGTMCGANALATGFTIAAVGAFGEQLTHCQVDSFRLSDEAGTRREYKGSFRGLVADDLPDGEYEVALQCREARIETRVKVSEFDRFKVVSQNRRITRSDHLIPQLVIRMTDPHPQGEVWWVTLRALYAERVYTGKFLAETGEADVADPDPGSYLVSVLSNSGSDCLREIDLVESTRLWSLDRATCTFHVDASAHVVTEEDKRDLKRTRWYKQLRKNDEELFRALEKGADLDSKE
jgi:hypothetical protein